MYNAGKQITPQIICAKQMFERWALQTIGDYLLDALIIGDDNIRKDRTEDDYQDDGQADHRGRAFAIAAPDFCGTA